MKKQELITLGIATLVFISVVVAYVWWFNSLATLQGETRALQTQIDTARATSAHASRIAQASVELTAEEALVASHLVHTNDVVSFLHYVETSGAPSGALVKVVSVSESPTKDSITLALHIQGSFSAVLQTLGALEYGPYIVSAKSVTLDTREDGVWQLSGSFTTLSSLP